MIDVLRGKLAEEDIVEGSRLRVLTDVRDLNRWYEGTYGEPIDPADIRLTSMDLAEYRTHTLRHVKPITARRRFASIRKMLKLLNPRMLVELRFPKLPQPTHHSPSGFTRRERLAIFRAAEQLDARGRAIIHLLMWTGARASSIAKAKLSNVVIRARSGSITYDSVKGRKVVSVPLNREARAALAAWIDGKRQPVDHDFLFHSLDYPFHPLTRWTIHSVWHRSMKRHLPPKLAAKIRGPHQARHALARMLIHEQGVPLPDVAAILANSVAVTGQTYCRPSEDDLRRHLERAVGEDEEE